jgi:uncharacterized protein YkwD
MGTIPPLAPGTIWTYGDDVEAQSLRPAFRRAGLALLVAAVLASGLTPAVSPAPVQAGTAETMESHLVGWINASRTKLGLRPLRASAPIASLAGYRAGVMASTGVLSHTIAGCLSCELTARGIQWYSEGEAIAWNSYTWGDSAALALFNWWKGSSLHWSLLMSKTFNYIGVGVAYRSANRTTWGDIVLTESVDHTSPWAHMTGGSRSGTTVTWTWAGGDIYLQTHTSGLHNFDVEYRVDSGSWVVIRSGITSKYLSLAGRARGHYYGLRVRSRDWRGYVSGWSAEVRVWVS